MCERCLQIARIAEMQAIYHDLFVERDDIFRFDKLVEFAVAFGEINEGALDREMVMKTCVRVERGKRAGHVGVIHGSFETRRRLIEMGLTKTTVRFDDGELEMLLLENLQELTTQEKILLGLI